MPIKKSTTSQNELLLPLQLQSPKDNVKGKEMGINEEEEKMASSFPQSKPKSLCYFSPHNCSCAKQSAAAAAESTETFLMLHEEWRESQRSTVTQITRQLQTKWALNSIINAQLGRLQAHYTRTMLPSHPRDVPRLLFPSWNWKPPFLTASISWLGDTWRPSSILSLVIPTLSSPIGTPHSLHFLEESIRRFCIQEAVLEEEMAEYQSMSVLNLRPALKTQKRKGKREGRSSSSKMETVCKEIRKVECVMQRAQKLRYKAVEVAVRGGVLDETRAAEFLLALAGVEEAVEHQAVKWHAQAGDVSVQVQALD